MVSREEESSRKRLPQSKFFRVEPDVLVFPPPYHDRSIRNTVFLYNCSASHCIFKLYARHPNYYHATPNIAVVAPNSASRIHITLQSTEDKFEQNFTDKFQLCVKFISLPETELSAHPGTLWKMLSSTVSHRCTVKAVFNGSVPVSSSYVSFLPPSKVSRKLHDTSSREKKKAEGQKNLPCGDTTVNKAAKTAVCSVGVALLLLLLVALLAFVCMVAYSVRSNLQVDGKPITIETVADELRRFSHLKVSALHSFSATYVPALKEHAGRLLNRIARR